MMANCNGKVNLSPLAKAVSSHLFILGENYVLKTN